MASNYWTSSHYQRWQSVHPTRLLNENKADLERGILTATDITVLHAFFARHLFQFGREIDSKEKTTSFHVPLRQRVIATAIVYYRRVYLNASFEEFNPLDVCPAVIMLAAKCEECHGRMRLLSMLERWREFTRVVQPQLGNLQDTTTVEAQRLRVVKLEYAILVKLEFDLIIYHPFRPLLTYGEHNTMKPLVPVALSILNDCYMGKDTLYMSHEPYLLALAALLATACWHSPKKSENLDWFRDLMHVELDKVLDLARQLTAQYNEQPLELSSEVWGRLQKVLLQKAAIPANADGEDRPSGSSHKRKLEA
jgi:cyclin-C